MCLRQQKTKPKQSVHTVHESCKYHKFHPVKIHRVQELIEDGTDRTQICETMEYLIVTQLNNF